MKNLIILVVSTFGIVILGTQHVHAQKIGEQGTATPVTKTQKVAFMDLLFWEVDKGEREYLNSAREPFEKALYGTFEKLGIARVDQAVVNAAWKELTGSAFSTKEFVMPDPADLVKLGQQLKVDYVVAASCHWRIRTPWVGLGPKTKAHATVDFWIVDVAQSEFALKAESVKSDSTEKAPDWKWAVDLFIAPISVISGGPKTDHQKKSGLLSLGKALDPWVEKQQTSTAKIKIGG